MKLQIIVTDQELRILCEGKAKLKDLADELEKLLPAGGWKWFDFETVETIATWGDYIPIVINPMPTDTNPTEFKPPVPWNLQPWILTGGQNPAGPGYDFKDGTYCISIEK